MSPTSTAREPPPALSPCPGYGFDDDAMMTEGDPAPGAGVLGPGAELLERVAGSLVAKQRARPCPDDLPAPTRVDVAWALVHTAHEVHHHLGEIERRPAAPA